MQNGTFQTRGEIETGRALVPVSSLAPRPRPDAAPAPFMAQLIGARVQPGRMRPFVSDQALRRYSAADALATAKTRSFERVV
jgi:hypothetical protein